MTSGSRHSGRFGSDPPRPGDPESGRDSPHESEHGPAHGDSSAHGSAGPRDDRAGDDRARDDGVRDDGEPSGGDERGKVLPFVPRSPSGRAAPGGAASGRAASGGAASGRATGPEPAFRPIRLRPAERVPAERAPHEPERAAWERSARVVRPPSRRVAGNVTPFSPRRRRADEPDDFAHRMKTNGLALVLVLLLMGCGYWIASRLAGVGDDHACLVAGRPGCGIALPEAAR